MPTISIGSTPRCHSGMLRSSTVIALCLLAALNACTYSRYARKAEPPPPPPPPPGCSALPAPPRTIDGSPLSSGLASAWSMVRVRGASTPDNEFGLLPISGSLGMLLAGSTNRDANAELVRRSGPAHIDRVSADDASATSSDLRVMMTIVPAGRVMGDAAVGTATVSGKKFEVDALPIIDQEVAWDGHPTVTPDGRWIIFSSDRQGAFGGADLWYAATGSGKVGSIRPLYGANTPCDELSPFVTNGGVLLFSSAGHTTHGGYDIHEAELISDADSLRAEGVTNLGTPLNSAADEIFPVMLEDSSFYVASTRNDGRDALRRDFDVFVLYREQAGSTPISNIDTATTLLVGKVINAITSSPIVDAEVIARLPQSTNVIARARTDTAGTYRLQIPVERPVEITAQDDELFFDNFVTTIPASERNRVVQQEKPLGLSPTLTLRVNFPTGIFDEPYPFTLDSNGIETERSWKRDVDDLIRNVTTGSGRIKRVVLTGHTDDVDDDESNLLLGKRRVQFIIDRLIEGGLAAELLEGRSAGEQQLLMRRPDESIDSWRRRCRRVELVKVQ